MIIKYCFIFLVNLLTTFFAFGQNLPVLDVPSSVMSDFKSLQEHIEKKVIYPADARNKGIQGIVYVQFKIDSSGMLIKNSVKTLHGLFPSCDREAERVVRLYNKKWAVTSVNKMVREMATRQPFFIPIKFVLTDDGSLDFPSHVLNLPARTIVLPKSAIAKDPAWALYSKKGFENSAGKISPGDSVTVTGWSAWCYYIQTKDVAGYISYHALQINSQMEAVAETVEDQSPEEEEIEEKIRELKQQQLIDTVYNFSLETAHLSLTASKKSIYVGECTVLTLAFNVRDDNELKIQFHDLGTQLNSILTTSLNAPNAFILKNNIVNIEGEENIVNNRKYTTYKIYQAAYCPNRQQPLTITPAKLKMLIWKKMNKDIEKIAEFTSSPLTVNVKPLPSLSLTAFNRYMMVGKFTMDEKVSETNVTVGKPFTYQVRIRGEGLIFPLEPPKLSHQAWQAELRDIHSNDTIINEVLHSDKTFIYRVILRNEGTQDLSHLITYSFYNPSTNKKETIRSSLKIIASKANEGEPKPLPENQLFYSKNNVIAIDASQSMMIEDYLPNRLHVVKEGLKKFLQDRTRCDIGIITFAGDAHVVNLAFGNSCYSSSRLDSITCLPKSGTAIGDAIWLARMSVNRALGIGKIVVIGDGDNTAGALSPQYAAELAKKSNIQIYTIGIGNTGAVPFGRDNRGRPNMIEDTFRDKDFREISTLTGGQYYHARNAQEISEILDRIFK